MGDFLEYRTQKQFEGLKEPYTPTTEEVEVFTADEIMMVFKVGIARIMNRKSDKAAERLFRHWLSEHDREQRAIGWDERDNAKPSYLGPDNGHYLDDCGGYEDCFCASYPNPYREVSK